MLNLIIGISVSLIAAIIFFLSSVLINFILAKKTLINKCHNKNYYISKLNYTDFLIDPKTYNKYFKEWELTELLKEKLLGNKKLIIISGRSRTGKTRAVLETLKLINKKNELNKNLNNYLFISPTLELLKNPNYRKFIPRNFLFRKKNFIIFLDNALSLKFSGAYITEFLEDFFDKYNDVIVIMIHSKEEIINTNIDLNFFLEDYRKKLKIVCIENCNYLKETIIDVPRMPLKTIIEINENLNNRKNNEYLIKSYDGSIQPLFYPESINYSNFNLLDNNSKKIMFSVKLIFYSGFFPFAKHLLFKVYTSPIFNGDAINFEESLKKLLDLQFINIVLSKSDFLIIDPGILSRALKDYPFNKNFTDKEIKTLFDCCFNIKDIDRMMNIVNKLSFNGQINESVNYLKKVLKIVKNNKYLWGLLGAQLVILNKNEESIEAFKEALKIDKSFIVAWDCLSDQYLFIGKKKEANEATKKAIFFGSKNHIIWYNYGNILCYENKFGEAEKAFKKAIELDKNDKQAWFNLGNSLRWQNKYFEAEKAYKKAIEIDGKYVNALMNLEVVLSLQNKYDEAIETLKKIPKSDPRYPLIEFNLENLLEKKKEMQDVLDKEKEILENVEKNKFNKNLWFDAIIFYLDYGMYSQAEILIKKALKSFERTDGFYNLLGVTLYFQQKYIEANSVFKKSSIKDYDIYIIWGNVLRELKKFNEAYKVYRKAIVLNRTGKEVWHNIGIILAEKKNFRKAILAFKKSLKSGYDFALPHNALGACYYELKDFEKAEKEFKTAIEKDDKSITAYGNLGELYFEQKKYSECEIVLKKIFGFIEEFDKKLCECLEKQNKFKEANQLRIRIKAIIYKNSKLFYPH